MIISGSGVVTVVRRERDAELVELVRALTAAVENDVAPALDALKSIATDLSARGGSVATRMINVQVERIAEVLTSGVAQPRGMGPRSGLLTKREAAQLCGVSLRTFERRVMDDLVPTRVGRRVLYAAEEVERWLDEQKAGSSSGILGRRSWR
jgi:predicted DNA-binding transcriptional regulator AlpA